MKMTALMLWGLFSLSTFSVKAATTLQISAEKATVTLQGSTQDFDALNLFRALDMDATAKGDSLSKSLQFQTSDGKPAFDLQCEVSKAEDGVGTCLFNIYKSRFAKIDATKGTATFSLGIYDAKDIVSKFSVVDPEMGDDVFLSSDDKVGIEMDGQGTPRALLRIWMYEN